MDRFISIGNFSVVGADFRFPSPLEVDRFISITKYTYDNLAGTFPSPLEVDRFISRSFYYENLFEKRVSVPSRGG